jgi:hypothetical protein
MPFILADTYSTTAELDYLTQRIREATCNQRPIKNVPAIKAALEVLDGRDQI